VAQRYSCVRSLVNSKHLAGQYRTVPVSCELRNAAPRCDNPQIERHRSFGDANARCLVIVATCTQTVAHERLVSVFFLFSTLFAMATISLCVSQISTASAVPTTISATYANEPLKTLLLDAGRRFGVSVEVEQSAQDRVSATLSRASYRASDRQRAA
jgi:hypothetical protein